ncbi:MAG: T9SS type A sorting domain-containing protein, partial [Spirochaetes bacterium]|nr:T9SS type A sorting domain-containing protein [Spirochaetota bacterium]
CTWDSTALGGSLSVTGAITVSAGTLALGNKAVSCATISVTAGDFDMGSSTVLVASDATITTAGVFNAGTSTLQITDSVAPAANVNITLPMYHFQVSGAAPGGATLAGNLTINGNLNVTGSLNDGGRTITLYGNAAVTGAGVFTGTGTVVFAGAVNQTVNPGSSSFFNLTKQGNSRLTVQTNALTVTGTLTITAAADIVDLVDRDFAITTLVNNGTLELDGTQAAQTVTTMDMDSGTVRYKGASGGTITLGDGVSLTLDFFNLTVDSAGATFSLGKDTRVHGDVTIGANTSLDAAAGNFPLTVSGDWNNTLGTFVPRLGTVSFNKPAGTIRVWGDNQWFIFDCQVPAITIEFQESKTQTIVNVAGATLRIKGTPPGPPRPANDIKLYSMSLGTRWNIVVGAAALLDMEYVLVDWSQAAPNITTPGLVDITVNCIGWLKILLIVSSQTEDSDGDGKIDRIRARAVARINDNFSAFVVHVDNYALAEPKFLGTGSVADPLADEEFWILLQEKPYLDTGVTPQWWIDSNTSLRDTDTGGIYIVTLSNPVLGETPLDRAFPRFGYTLAVADRANLAGKGEIFVQFSEPVFKGAAAIDRFDFTYKGVNPDAIVPITTSGLGTIEVILEMGSPITAVDIVTPQMISVVGPIQDQATQALTSLTHRVSDVGLGLAGNSLFEPVFAHDETTGVLTPGIGRIIAFDGTKWLRDQQIALEGSIHALGAPVTPPWTNVSAKIWYDANVAASLKSAGGLWMPPYDETAWNGLVPSPNSTGPGSRTNQPPADTQLRDFIIPAADPKIVDGARLEFLFEIIYGGLGLYCARLTDPAASDWYLHVVPWAFDIHEIKMQKGNVNILSNVINPNLGQMVTLQYIQPTTGSVTISVFDLAGNLVRVLARASGQAAGDYAVTWDGKNKGGRSVARGIYFIRIVAPGIDETRKVLVVR